MLSVSYITNSTVVSALHPRIPSARLPKLFKWYLVSLGRVGHSLGLRPGQGQSQLGPEGTDLNRHTGLRSKVRLHLSRLLDVRVELVPH